jgi:restriction endonuclease-like protein/putative AbiEi antitoxin of type IV toxin-antitoxin system
MAERQHGVIALRQLVALGFSRSAIRRRTAAGRLHRLHVGVYAVGHRRLSVNGRWMAAVLACGPTALLSHRDAAALHGLLGSSAHSIHVTAARRCWGRPGIKLHRSRLDPEDRTIVDGIPVTSVERTLLDLAEVVPRRLLERALEQAEQLRLLDVRAIDRVIDRAHGRHGIRGLRAALGAYRSTLHVTRSGLERRFLALCHEAGLPRPAVNVWLAGMEVDVVWRDCRLAVELDTHAHHGTRAAFERDRARDAALQLAGYRVLRVTDRRLDAEPEAVMKTVRSLLTASAAADPRPV